MHCLPTSQERAPTLQENGYLVAAKIPQEVLNSANKKQSTNQNNHSLLNIRIICESISLK
jgi:hypothetical protein